MSGAPAKLSGPARQVALVAVGAVVMAGMLNLKTILSDPRLGLFGLGAVALVAVVLGLYTFGRRLFAKARSNPFSSAMTGLLRGKPGGMTPEEIAELDRLDKSFEKGLEIFRRAGKNVYELPWYVFVGEPGSGKSEAIRRSGIPSPGGLNDPLQGVGGTINMNWWFNNHAVILDTAGKMMFKGAPPGRTTEWKRFLEWLRKARRRRPITGMFLVIPADTLIDDPPEKIEEKAGTIAERFDAIQKVLGVRFPVYVLVTKCDTIPGFRDFFADLTGPGIQEQLVGWSNPDLEHFDPQQVVQHLETVKKRMVARRRALLLDPVHTEDPAGRRLDQVDALYEFPEEMMRLSPRLTRYLETIFTQGAWSALPLFLRGIYFTSARQEGEECDKAIADMLGIGVKQLRGGAHWAQERAMFLRDLFLGKAFKELGLVSRARNVRAARRRALTAVLTVACVAVATLFALGWRWAASLKRDITDHARYFEFAAERAGARAPRDGAEPDWTEAIGVIAEAAGSMAYIEGDPDPQGEPEDHPLTLLRTLRDLTDEANAPRVPGIFRVFQGGGGWGDRLRRGAVQAYELTLLGPVVQPPKEEYLVTRLLREEDASVLFGSAASAEDGPLTGAEARAALAGLVTAVVNTSVKPESRTTADASAIVTAAVAEPKPWRERAAEFRRLGEELGARGALHASPAAEYLDADDVGEVFDALGEGVKGRVAGSLKQLQEVDDAAKAFAKADADLRSLASRWAAVRTVADHQRCQADWGTHILTLKDAADRLASNVPSADKGLAAWFDAALADSVGGLRSRFDVVLGVDVSALPEKHRARDWLDGLGESLDRAQQDAAEANKPLKDSLSSLETDLLAPTANAKKRIYQLRAEVYQAADVLMKEDQPAEYAPGEVASRLDGVTAPDAPPPLRGPRGELASGQAPEEWLGAQEEAAGACVRAVRRAGLTKWIGDLAGSPALSAEGGAGLAATVAAQVAAGDGKVERMSMPPLPLTGDGGERHFRDEFHPDVSAKVFDDLRALRTLDSPPSPEAPAVLLSTDAGPAAPLTAARAAMEAYAGDYARYWAESSFKEAFAFRQDADWRSHVDALAALRPVEVRPVLRNLNEQVTKALGSLKGVFGEKSEDQAMVGEAAAQCSLENRRLVEAFDAACGAERDAWVDLGDDAGSAGTKVLRMEPAPFRRDFLPNALPGEGATGVRYWAALERATLEVLVDSHEKGRGDPLGELGRAEWNAFPIQRTQKSALPPARLPIFRNALESVGQVAGAQQDLKTLGGGAMVGDPAIDGLVKRLRGEGMSPAQTDRVRAWSLLCEALAPGGQPLRCTFDFIEFNEAPQRDIPDDARPGAINGRYCELVVGGAKADRFALGSPTSAGRAPSGEPSVQDKVAWVLKEQDRDEAPAIGPPLAFDGPWGLLEALRDPECRSTDGTSWDVPLRFQREPGGATYTHWLRFKLSRPLPNSEQWPR